MQIGNPGQDAPDVTPDLGVPRLETRNRGLRSLLSLGLGLLLSLPVLVVLGGLLASADPIFASKLEDLLQLISLEKLLEYAVRIVLIMFLAYFIAGGYLYSLIAKHIEKVYGNEPDWPAPFLGWMVSSTILVCVNILFGFFVLIQLRYFFGGSKNISTTGYTYAEYARRGYGELLTVTFFSLLLFLVLNALTKRENKADKWTFSGLGICLVVLVLVILLSAYQRLLLYEAAYGFTRLRIYAHVHMVWLGILLLTTVTLEVSGKMRYFALMGLLAGLGFTLSLSILNVDALIVHQNALRAARGEQYDLAYLSKLSDDSIPALFSLFTSQETTGDLHDLIGATLACHAAQHNEAAIEESWPEFHSSSYTARRLYALNAGVMAAYSVENTKHGWAVKTGTRQFLCAARE